MEELSSKRLSSHHDLSIHKNNLLLPPAPKKPRYSPMKIFQKEKNKKVVSHSNRSIFQLANKFRNKSSKNLLANTDGKNIFDVIKEVPSPLADSSKKLPAASNALSPGRVIPIESKLTYNLNYSSSDSVGDSDDSFTVDNDLFEPTKPTSPKTLRFTENLKKAITKRVRNRELKFNNLLVGDEFTEKMADCLKKNNNLQKIQLSNNKISTRGAIAIFNKISNSCYCLDISGNPEIKKDAYKYLCRYILKDYRKKITELDLEGNLIGDKPLQIL